MTGKVYDRRTLVVDRSPLKQLAVEVGKFPPATPSQLAQRFAEMLEQYGLAAIEEVTGLDLSGTKRALDNLKLLLGGIDLDPADFDPVEAAMQFIENVLVPTGLLGGANWGELFTKLTGTASPEDGLTAISDFLKESLFGKIGANRLPLIGLGQVRDVAQNKFLNGDFDGPDSLAGLDDWDQRADDGFADGHQLGSAWTTADGLTHIIRSNNIEVNQSTVVFKVRAKWLALVANAGQNAIRVNMAGYQGNTQTVAPYQVAGIASPAGNSPSAGTNGWDTLLQVTVGPTPANVDNVNFELVVTSAATAGQVGFDKASATLSDKLPQTYINGLTEAIAGLWGGIQSRINDFRDLLDTFGGFGVGTGQGQLTDVATRLQGLNPLTGIFDAAKLGNQGAITLPNGLAQVPTLGALVDGATNALSGLSQTGEEMIGVGVDTAKQTMENLFDMLAANTRKVQALEAQQTANAVGGRQFNINFADYPDGPFPPALFNLTYSGAPGATSTLVIAAGKAQWNKVNNGYRRATMIYPTKTLTSFQVVRGTMSSPPEQGTNVRIWSVGRSNQAGTDYVFARGYCTGFLTYRGDIGCVRGGVEYIWAQNISLTWSLDLRVIMGVGTNARRHMVLSGDTIVWDGLEPSDPTKQSYLDTDHLYWGAISETDGAHAPGNVAGASTVDNAPPTVVGTTANFSKRTGGDMSIPAGEQPVPNNFYETIDYISPDLIYRPGSNCEVEVTKQGTYVCMWRAFHGNFATGSGGVGLLWKKPAGGAWAPVRRSVWGSNPVNVGFGVMADSTDATCGMVMVPMNPGDVLRPGFAFTANMANTGDNVKLADGSQTWFSVTRVGI